MEKERERERERGRERERARQGETERERERERETERDRERERVFTQAAPEIPHAGAPSDGCGARQRLVQEELLEGPKRTRDWGLHGLT